MTVAESMAEVVEEAVKEEEIVAAAVNVPEKEEVMVGIVAENVGVIEAVKIEVVDIIISFFFQFVKHLLNF